MMQTKAKKVVAVMVLFMVFVIAWADSLLVPFDMSIAALFLVPILVASLAFFAEGGMLTAALCAVLFIHTRGGTLTKLEVEEVLQLACFFLVAYFVGRTRRMLERTERLAACDPLTGVYNRRYFMIRLSEEMERARRLQHPLSLLMIDVDHFKHFNDQFGHPRGDFVLQRVAFILRANCRRIDVVARLGGDEFAVILAGADGAGARLVAKRLREKVASEGTAQLPFVSKITISIGMGEWNAAMRKPEELVEVADRALYADKTRAQRSLPLDDHEPMALAG